MTDARRGPNDDSRPDTSSALDRREFLKASAVATTAAIAGGLFAAASAAPKAPAATPKAEPTRPGPARTRTVTGGYMPSVTELLGPV